MASILMVEDDLMIARMLSLRLEMNGHSVDVAENGLTGYQKAMAGDYDVVLMDMHMPVMDGREAVRKLREQGYTKTVVAVTASAMNEDTAQALDAGCDYFIAKPIGEDFEQRLEAIIANG